MNKIAKKAFTSEMNGGNINEHSGEERGQNIEN